MATLKPQSEEEFFIQYAPIPQKTSKFLVALSIAVLLFSIALGYFLPLLHHQFNNAQYTRNAIQGMLLNDPVPILLVPRPGETGSEANYSHYLITGLGKTGPSQKILKEVGKWVELSGFTFYRNNLTVIAAASAKPAELPNNLPPIDPMESLGEFSLVGEIVDCKSYAGAMKPGHTKTHRGAAVRSISGGVPPLFVVQNEHQDFLYFFLMDEDNQPVNDRILKYVADPLRITGEVIKQGDFLILQANPETYQVLL